MKKKCLSTFVFMFLVVLICNAAGETRNNPVAVSPGSETEVVTVWQSCPTFSWSAVDQAASYRVTVFESVAASAVAYENMAVISSPVISKDIVGPALSWTIPAEEKLKTGSQYAWYVQALDANGNTLGPWSNGKIFKVEQELRFAGVAEKLETILKSYGVKDDTITNVLDDMKSEVQEVVVENKPGINGVKGTEGDYNTFYGKYAGASTTGTQNAFFGVYAGYNNSSGYYNTFLGDRAGLSNTSGIENTFVGKNAGRANNDGHYNTMIGSDAGYYTDGTRNSFLGYRAGFYSNGNYNTYLGYQAGFQDYYSNSGSYNAFVGDSAGYYNTTGDRGAFLGYYAGQHNTSGDDNTFLGYFAGVGNTSGYSNTIIGNSAGYTNQTGSNNIFLGYQAGYNETGSNKLYIENSNSSSPLIYGEFDNDIVTINGKLGIGTQTPTKQIDVTTSETNACIQVKRTDGATNYINATDAYANFGSVTDHPLRLVVNSTWKMMVNTDGSLSMYNGASCTTGGVWTNASSRALKENIESLSTDEAMDALTRLNPVKYNYKVDKSDKHVGFIAEDVPELVAASDRKGLSPMDVTAVLTKVVQELQKENQEYKKIISDLQERIAKLEKNNDK